MSYLLIALGAVCGVGMIVIATTVDPLTAPAAAGAGGLFGVGVTCLVLGLWIGMEP